MCVCVNVHACVDVFGLNCSFSSPKKKTIITSTRTSGPATGEKRKEVGSFLFSFITYSFQLLLCFFKPSHVRSQAFAKVTPIEQYTEVLDKAAVLFADRQLAVDQVVEFCMCVCVCVCVCV